MTLATEECRRDRRETKCAHALPHASFEHLMVSMQAAGPCLLYSYCLSAGAAPDHLGAQPQRRSYKASQGALESQHGLDDAHCGTTWYKHIQAIRES